MNYVYIDVLFLINFFIDLSLLILTAIYCNERIYKGKFVLAALIGALYGIAWVLYFDPILYSIVGKFIFSLVLIRIAFNWKNVKVFTRTTLTFYVINVVAAGAIFTMQMLVLSNKELYQQWIQFGEHNIWILETSVVAIVFGIPLSFLVVKNMWLSIKKISWKSSWVSQCTLSYHGKQITFKGLLDTGNQLTDPISNLPVSIIEYDMVKELLPCFVNTIYARNNVNMADFHYIIQKNSQYDTFTFIPYRGMGSDHNYLLAFRPDSLRIHREEGDIYNNRCLVGIIKQELSSTGDFNGIIHPLLLEGSLLKREEMLHEYISEETPPISQA